MKTRIIYTFWLLFISIAASAQTTPITGKSFELDDNQSLDGTDKTYIGRDYIKLKQGFSFSSTGSKKFNAKLDENLPPFDVEYVSATIPASHTIDQNLPVGTTAGSFAVSPTGAATYTIPIEVPPGTAGMQPSLAVSYNSQGGDGIMGMGWNISGLSAITRTGKTIYHDGQLKGVNLDANDRFSYDGNRLVVVTGNYGEDASEYRTEMETFSKITVQNSFSSNNEWFQVETKDGKIIDYGNGNNSRIVAGSSNKAIAWMISKIKDRNGNYIKYSYKNEGDSEYVIDKIEYTINDGFIPNAYNSVNFYYETKEDLKINKIYVSGNSISQSLLLNNIKIKNDGYTIKEYKFNYTEDFYPLLADVIEFGIDGTNFNSTSFYNNLGLKYYTLDMIDNDDVDLGGKNAEYWVVDYNGDGKSDLLQMVWDLITGEGATKEWLNWNLFKNNGDNTFISVYAEPQNFPDDFEPSDNFYPLNKGSIGNMIVNNIDFNGDNLEDIIFTSINKSSYYTYTFNPFISDGSQLQQNQTFSNYSPLGDNHELTLRYLDIDGDQRIDIFTHSIDLTDNGWVRLRINGNISSPTPTMISSDYNFTNSYPIDIDGDGITELANIFNLNDYKFYYIKFTGASFTFIEHPSELLGLSSLFKLLSGDFNGDGKSDILKYSMVNSKWSIAFNKGNLTFEEKEYTDFENPFYNYDIDEKIAWHYVIDFNSDGKSDILEIYNSVSNNTKFRLFLSNGHSFTRIDYTDLTWVFDKELHELEFGDFDGDGIYEIFINKGLVGTSDDGVHIIDFNLNKENLLLKSVVNGINNGVSIEYKPLTDNSVYSKSNNSNFPVSDVQFPLFVTSSVKSNNGLNSHNETTYFYTGAKLHKQGKGFLGFAKTETTNITSGFRTENIYASNSPSFSYSNPVNLLVNTNIFQGSNFVSSNNIGYNYHNFGSKRFFYYKMFETFYDKLKDITTSTTYIYNSTDVIYGNLSSSTTTFSNDATKSTSYTYSDIGIGFPTHIATVNTSQTHPDDADNTYSRSKSFTYQDYKLKTETTDLGVTNTYTYDNFGNVESTTVSAPDIESQTTNYYYDTKGRFNIKKTFTVNSIDFISESGFDSKTGYVLWTKNINNLITSYKYDGFGRLIETTLPNGKKVYNSLHWCDLLTPEFARYYSESTGSEIPTQKEYFDILGRSIRTEQTSFGDKTIIASSSYNTKGQLSNTISPHFTDGIGITTDYTYDNYGRLETTTTPINTITYSNSGLTQTVTNSGTSQTSSKTYDASGLLDYASDAGGYIDYTYYASGNIYNIKYNNGGGSLMNTISMIYDDFGRQTSLTDPDAGTTSYTYNSIGELLTQTDARANTYTMTYDKLGRLTSKSNSTEGTINYNYDTENYGKGKIASITADNGTSQSFKYNTLGQTTNLKETISGQNFETKYEYDNFGRMKKTIYPSDFGINYSYDNKGIMTQITRSDNSSSSIWQMNELNAIGQVTKYTLGNGLETTKEYSDYGFPVHFKTTDVYDYEFNFDHAKGNLDSRINNIVSGSPIQEDFTYDAMQRLETTVISSTTTSDVDYYTNGNIKKRNGIGEYFYTATQPHAISQLENLDNSISENLQTINYNTFNKVSDITEDNKTMVFTYGVDGERRKSELFESGNPTPIQTKLYSLNYEKITTGDLIRELHYIHAPNGLCAVYEENSLGAKSMYYTYTDYLGSITAITDEDATVLQLINYDAWGNRSLTYNETGFSDYLLDRGYTGHEHLDIFGLINMNGRLYDPMLGRMLSPDNYVQSATYSQSFNRYSYALNNPMKYIDPDGDIIIESIMIGFFIGAVTTGWQGGTPRQIMNGAVIGGVAGGVGSAAGVAAAAGVGAIGISGGFIGGAVAGGIGGAAGGFVSGAGNAWIIQGADLNTSLSAGWKGAEIGFYTGALIGGITGGISAHNKGLNPWTGKPYEIRLEQEPLLVSNDLSSGKPSPPEKLDFNKLTKPQRTAHLYNSIKYENTYGDGVVDLNEIFSNYDPNQSGVINQGFRSGVVKVNVGSDSYITQLEFSTFVDLNGNYNSTVNFGSATSVNNMTGPYASHYWGWQKNGSVYRLGVGSTINGDWTNFNNFTNWLGY